MRTTATVPYNTALQSGTVLECSALIVKNFTFAIFRFFVLLKHSTRVDLSQMTNWYVSIKRKKRARLAVGESVKIPMLHADVTFFTAFRTVVTSFYILTSQSLFAMVASLIAGHVNALSWMHKISLMHIMYSLKLACRQIESVRLACSYVLLSTYFLNLV